MAAKRRSTLAGRAWRLLSLALLWARKGGALKRGVLLGLRLHLKALRASGQPKKIAYLEREFSFDETPVFHFKMHRPASMRFPRIPCINPENFVDDDDDDSDVFLRRYKAASPFLADVAAREEEYGSENDEEIESEGGEEEEEEEECGIDSKAEEFIARFYQQMRMQRQVSLLQYNEMLQRGTS